MEFNVLIVEDSPIARKMAKNILSNLGYKVDTAKTGEEALILFETRNYDIIFMDIGLPGLNGIEITKKIRKQKKGIKIPIIALTANDDYKKECLDSGINGFLLKPLEKQSALSVIALAKNKRIDLKSRSNQHDTDKNS